MCVHACELECMFVCGCVKLLCACVCGCMCCVHVCVCVGVTALYVMLTLQEDQSTGFGELHIYALHCT